jgi:CRP-like cAMP-binding protein
MEKNLERTHKILQHTPLFHAIASEQMGKISEKVEEVRLAKNEMLFQAGELPSGFYIVAFGQIKLAVTSPVGDEKIVEIIGQRQSFGEAVMFLHRPYPISAIALVDTLLLKIPLQVVDALLMEDHSFAKRMLAGLSVRLHSLLQDVESYSIQSSLQRVISYLLLLCPEGCENSLEVSLPTSKLVIASRLNLTPETLSRIFHDLTRNKLIVVNGRSIQIPDLKSLREFLV